MAEPITIDEILASLASCSPGKSDGASVTEIIARTGQNAQTVRKYLAQAIAAGKVVCVRESRPCIDGSSRMIPTYRAVQTEPPAKRKKS